MKTVVVNLRKQSYDIYIGRDERKPSRGYFGNPHCDHIARWANRKQLYWGHDFEDYGTKSWSPLRKRNKSLEDFSPT